MNTSFYFGGYVYFAFIIKSYFALYTYLQYYISLYMLCIGPSICSKRPKRSREGIL